MSKPLPKSLHTVTVLVRLTERLKEHYPSPEFSDDERMDITLDILGYSGGEDPYKLVAAAKKQLD